MEAGRPADGWRQGFGAGMKFFRVLKDCSVAKLHDELTSAGQDVVVVMGAKKVVDSTSFASVVVCNDNVFDNAVVDIIKNHVADNPSIFDGNLQERIVYCDDMEKVYIKNHPEINVRFPERGR